MNKTKSGFTIVELLIVIVVIAILAAITIVGYNGIQKRAGTAAYVSAADSLEKQLRVAVMESETPFVDGIMRTVCLADPADLPETSIFAAGECRHSEPTSGAPISVMADSTISSRLKEAGVEYPINLSEVHFTLPGGGRDHWRGISVLLVQNGSFTLTWMSPDPSSCGRASNTVEAMITGIKADPQVLAGMVSQYGEDWEVVIRNYYGGAGHCAITVAN